MKVENPSRPCHLFFLSLVPAGFNIGRGFSRGIVRPFVFEAQRSTGSSAKSHAGGREIQTASQQGELVFPTMVLQGISY